MNKRGRCEKCNRFATIHLTEITDGRKRNREFCSKHVPPDVRARMKELDLPKPGGKPREAE